VTASGAKVDVVRGQVEVADFKTGQIAQVMPGQHAAALSSGNAGLSLGGSGMLQPIQQGQPRASSVDRVPVPRNGLTAPGKPDPASLQRQASTGSRHGVVRISSSLGEVRLNVNRVTRGLARNAGTVAGARSAVNRETSTVWASGETGSGSSAALGSVNNGNGSGNGSSGNGGSSGSEASGNSGNNSGGNTVASLTSTVTSVVSGVTGSGNGNGVTVSVGNGNGNGVSVSVGGNGVALGLGNGRGLALGFGNGNGNAFGRSR